MINKTIIVFSLFPLDHKMKTGGQARLKGLLTELKKISEHIHHICIYGNFPEPKTRKILTNINETWIAPAVSASNNSMVGSSTFITEDTIRASNIQNNKMLINFIESLNERNPIFIATHFWFGELIKPLKWHSTYLFSHNFESDFIDKISTTNSFADFYKSKESKLSNLFNSIVCCSNQDKLKFKNIIKNRTTDLLICRNGSFFNPQNTNFNNRKERNFLYIGSHWHANIEGIQKLIHDGDDFLSKNKIHLVGSIKKAFTHINKKNLFFYDILEEEELLRVAKTCKYAINPIFSGGGSNVKNADYLTLGLPVLTSEFGIRGYEKFRDYFVISDVESWDTPEVPKIPYSISVKNTWKFTLKNFINKILFSISKA